MRTFDLRTLTAAVVIAGCAFALWRGASIVGFGIAEALAAVETRAQAVRPWTATPGIASIARGASVESTAIPLDIDRASTRGQQIMDVLSLRPLASPYWLSLAGMQFATGRPDKIADALSLSALSGPNEGPTMARRALFGLALWVILPVDVRRHVINDLAGARLTDRDVNQIRLILAGKGARERAAIRAALAQTGRLSPGQRAAFGLEPDTPVGTVPR